MLNTKNVLITGCTKGIGLALVQKFASQGFNVAGCARNKKELTKLFKSLSESYLKQKFFLEVCDVSDKKAVIEFAKDALSEFKYFDVVINNAGIFYPGQIHSEEDGIFEQTIKTNLNSAYYLTRAVLPSLIENNSGHIFNICSTASITAYVNGGSYCISKYALLGMTKVLREELKPHKIRVTAVLPGATFTNSWSGTELPKTRFMPPEHIAHLVWNAYEISEYSNVEEILVRPIDGDIN